MAIYFKTEKEKFNSIEELLDEFYRLPGEYESVLMAPATFKDEECTQIQCKPNKTRSVDELQELIQTYIPEASFEEMVKALVFYVRMDISQNMTYITTPYHCGDIHKNVIFYQLSGNIPHIADNYIYTPNNTYSKHTWREMLSTIGINTLKELKDALTKNVEKRKEEILETA